MLTSCPEVIVAADAMGAQTASSANAAPLKKRNSACELSFLFISVSQDAIEFPQNLPIPIILLSVANAATIVDGRFPGLDLDHRDARRRSAKLAQFMTI
jgi:hypothetical protein